MKIEDVKKNALPLIDLLLKEKKIVYLNAHLIQLLIIILAEGHVLIIHFWII